MFLNLKESVWGGLVARLTRSQTVVGTAGGGAVVKVVITPPEHPGTGLPYTRTLALGWDCPACPGRLGLLQDACTAVHVRRVGLLLGKGMQSCSHTVKNSEAPLQSVLELKISITTLPKCSCATATAAQRRKSFIWGL